MFTVYGSRKKMEENSMKKFTGVLVVLVALSILATAGDAFAQKRLISKYNMDLEDKMDSMLKSRMKEKEAKNWKCVVNVADSNDGNGQDAELRFTMPLDEFNEFAPIAALEAAAIPHKFPVVYIYLRHEQTDRVARVAFKDAEPIAGRYRAGDDRAVREMNKALIWH
jgi:hypothetical protein